MELDVGELLGHMSPLVLAVVVALTLQALACLYVIVDRLLLLGFSGGRSRRFAQEAGARLEANDYDGVLAIAKTHDKSHLANYIAAGVSTFLERRREGHKRTKAAELARRAMERKGENLSENLNRGMSILASTGSTAPFIGLLGTVLGILSAFRMIGEEASGGMATIGPMIAEALVVTGFGLLVAIPAVLCFNWLSGRIAKYEAGLANAGSELVDQFEAGAMVKPVEETQAEPERRGVPATATA